MYDSFIFFTFPLLILTSIGLFVGITKKEIPIIVISSWFIFIISIILLIGIYETQWIKLDGDNISVYNLFGLVKKQKLSDTKLAILADIIIINYKKVFKSMPFIVLSTRKSVVLADIQRSGNNSRKKNPYIIIPYTSENYQTIKQAYFEVTGQELNIGL